LGQTNNIVEVNGKRYDAITGAVVATQRPAAKSAAAIHARPRPGGQRTVDGFTRVSRDHDAKPATHKAGFAKPLHAKPRAAASHAVAHKPQRSATLMRNAVKKPAAVVQSSSGLKAQLRTDMPAVRHAHPLTHKLSYGNVDQDRHVRAHQVAKLPTVSHFGAQGFSSSATKPVAQAHNVPAIPAQPAGPLDFIATDQHHGAPVGVSTSSTDIFEQALASATSHEQTFEDVRRPKSRRRKRALGVVGVSLLLLLLVGFLSYTNAAQIGLKVASYRAGLDAKLPSSAPSDYTFNHLDYKPGTVVASYVSSSSNQGFNISQHASNWDSQTLLSNVVSTTKEGYKTYQRAGRTVYILSNNTATWVDSGVLYTVEGNAKLTSSELLDLASAM
jgi:hypothetical protein